MHPIFFEYKPFENLTAKELYNILQLRSEVFVVEQNCVFLDMDGKDDKAMHVMGYFNNQLVAYTRLLQAGISYTEASIGRVVTKPSYRKHGFGKILMEQSIALLYQLYGKQTIKIGAQLYLLKFYQSFGFAASSDVYDEDGIDHIEMILT